MADEAKSESSEIVRIDSGQAGSSGEQLPGPVKLLQGQEASRIDQRHLGAALRDFSDVRSVAVSTIAVAAFRDSQDRIAQLSRDIESLRQENRDLERTVQAEREKRIVIEVRLHQRVFVSGLGSACQIFGSLAAGTGLPLLLQGDTRLGGVLTGFGVAIALLGLTLSHRGGAR